MPAGLVDVAGNVWMQDENGQQGVMLNLDIGYREGRQIDGPVIEENGILHRMH